MPIIVIVGAGVSGLTCALQLARENRKHEITVLAKHMPGDYDIEYTSPWAGANVQPMAFEADSRWERRTWPEFRRLASEVPEAGVHFQANRVYRRKKDVAAGSKGGIGDGLFAFDPWYKDMMDNYRELSPHELPADVHSGCEFTSVCINTAIYLPWLVGQCLARRVVFERVVLTHITEAAKLSAHAPKADVVINATGLLARKLGGVLDKKLFPARGQIVLVRNSASPIMLSTSGCDNSEDELVYIMTRAAGGGTVLGGTYAKGNWDAKPDPHVALRIMKRAVEVYPELVGGKGGIEKLSVIRHGVGLRPEREGGVRIEKERIGDVWVVHNYGHAGWGYQGSYGCAERVLEVVDEVVGARTDNAKAKL